MDSPETGFGQFQLSPPLLEALEESGYRDPTPIQARTIPALLEGRDVIGQAQTGTGKTAAFALPMLERIAIDQHRTQVLVLAPTRELAGQVAESFQRYAAKLRGLRVAAVYGGQDYPVQIRQLNRGAHVVVGTPGRVIDHLRRGTLKLEGLSGLVLDEADEMLRMGFVEDVQWILSQSPAGRQIALFSATMPPPIRRIAEQHLNDPVAVQIDQGVAAAETIRQRFVVALPHQKPVFLARILEAESTDAVMVFVRTKSATEPLAEQLRNEGFPAAALNGDMTQNQREHVVESLRSGKLDLLVATDVAARGLDVQRISHVINYDLPLDSESYVHRIGRTGRAGRTGEAILFVHPRERHRIKQIERATRQKIEPMELPSNRVINKQRVARFHQQITQRLAHPELETFASIIEQYRNEHDVPLELITAALASMAHGDTPLLLDQELRQPSFAGSSRSASETRRSRFEDSAPPRGRAARRQGAMETYRLEVGHSHQVRPGNIVGAIANEGGLESSIIGRIDIFDDYSTVDLPAGMPHEVFRALRQARIGGRRLNISRLQGGPSAAGPHRRKFAPAKKKSRHTTGS